MMEGTSPLLEEALQEAARVLGDEGEPWRAAFAPGRLNLIGAHVDHSGGPVLPIGLPQGTLVLARPGQGKGFRFLSLREGLHVAESLPSRGGGQGWADYLFGVLHFLLEEEDLDFPQGLDLVVHGDLLVGAGLSSSASLTVAATMAALEVAGKRWSPERVALLAYRAEHDFKGVSCGIQDPFASALALPGKALFLHCREIRWEYVPFPSDEVEIALCDTGVPRSLAGSAFNDRVAECREAYRLLSERIPGKPSLADHDPVDVKEARSWMPEGPWRRAMHVTREARRVEKAAVLLAGDDLEGFGELLWESYESSREWYQSTIPELDALVEAARTVPGCLGARLSGGGFGGAIFALLRPRVFTGFKKTLERAYLDRFERKPEIRKVEVGGSWGGLGRF